MDDELQSLDREALINEVERLRAGIRMHRDASGHDLCWFHPHLWSLLPEPMEPKIAVPNWLQFTAGCVAYRKSLDATAPTAERSNDEFNPSL